jgi:hypothetical protein
MLAFDLRGKVKTINDSLALNYSTILARKKLALQATLRLLMQTFAGSNIFCGRYDPKGRQAKSVTHFFQGNRF